METRYNKCFFLWPSYEISSQNCNFAITFCAFRFFNLFFVGETQLFNFRKSGTYLPLMKTVPKLNVWGYVEGVRKMTGHSSIVITRGWFLHRSRALVASCRSAPKLLAYDQYRRCWGLILLQVEIRNPSNLTALEKWYDPTTFSAKIVRN